MIMVLKLVFSLFLPILCSVVFLYAEKKTSFNKLPYTAAQLIIGFTFGIAAISATHLGIDIDGAVINTRNAAVLTSGLLFGGPAGIISGLIGGIERFTASFYGLGQFTQLACSLSTVLTGFIAALMRKYIFESKQPSAFHGLSIATANEILHMFLIFLTNLSDIHRAFSYVQKCTVAMIVFNSISVTVSIACASAFNGKRITLKRKSKKIEEVFRINLIICFTIAFAATSVFTYIVQNHIAKEDIKSILSYNMDDLKYSLTLSQNHNGDFHNISDITHNWHLGEDGCAMICDKSGKILSDNDGHIGDRVDKAAFDFLLDGSFDEEEVFTADIHNVSSFCLCSKSGDYYLITSIPKEEALFSRRIAMNLIISIELLAFSVLFIFIYFLIRKIIIKNIEKVNYSLSEITKGNLDETVNVYENEEFSVLSNDINMTVAALKQYISEAEKRIDKELELARQIQLSALPSVFPPYPNRTDFDIFAQMYTAKEVGGDFYDFYLAGENKLAFLIADVSDKGIPAAMFMMNAKTLIKALVATEINAAEVFTEANNRLCENNEAGMFITAWLGILDLSTGRLSYVNAGHNPPLIKQSSGTFEYLRSNANFVLAGIENIQYKECYLQLKPEDEIFLYTDGITEANNKKSELFGEDRLKDTLNKITDTTTVELCKAVKNSVDEFVDGFKQFDDMTMLAVKVNYFSDDSSIILSPKPETINTVYNFIDRQVKKLELDKKLSSKIKLITDEIYSNIINYSGAQQAKVSLHKENDTVFLKFYDNGKQYNPLLQLAPDISLPAEQREIGGLGLLLVKNIADKTEYSYIDEFNILTVCFE